MSTILETIQAIVRQEMARVRVADLGVVEAVQPHRDAGDRDNYGCDVRLKNSGLLLRRVPIATQHVGSAAIPNKGDLVLLTYDKGDVNQPIVIGRLYSDAARPPPNDTSQLVMRLPLAEPDDDTLMTLMRQDPSGSPKREARMLMPPRITLHVTDDMVHAVAGNSELKLDQPGAGGGTVTVMAGRSTITMDEDGDVVVESAGSLTIRATGDLLLEGKAVKIKSQMDMTLEAGMQATLSASMGATVDGGLSATVQGATVTVKGMTSFSM